MASRNYGMAFDTPYNERLLSILEEYNSKKDTNGQPDIFTDTMQGGAFLGTDGRVHTIHTLPYHPHLSHPMLGSMVREMDGGKFNFGKALGSVAKGVGKVALPIATKVGTKVAEDALMTAMMGAGVYSAGAMYRPAGMVSPFVHQPDPFSLVRSGTMATYPAYNAVEMRALEGGAGCCACGMDGGKFNFGKALGSVAKGVGKVALPIATKVGTKVAEDALMASLAGAGKKPRGRPRKMMVDGANSAMGASGSGVGSGGKFNLGKALKKTGRVLGKVAKASAPVLKAVGKEVVKVGLPIAEKMATKMAEKAISDYMKGDASGAGVYSAGVGEMKRPRGRPRSGGKFDLLESIKKVGTSAGKPFDKAVGVNPFTLGFDLGHDVIAPAIFGEKKGKGVRSGGGDGRKMRAEIVKKVMKEHGLKMTDASKFVKAHGLY
jgi:hypothetical protein